MFDDSIDESRIASNAEVISTPIIPVNKLTKRENKALSCQLSLIIFTRRHDSIAISTAS